MGPDEFLRELHDNGELNTELREMPRVLPYHVSCQTHAHRMGSPALDVMTLVPGLDIREGRARCCGLAGTYGYKADNCSMAQASLCFLHFTNFRTVTRPQGRSRLAQPPAGKRDLSHVILTTISLMMLAASSPRSAAFER